MVNETNLKSDLCKIQIFKDFEILSIEKINNGGYNSDIFKVILMEKNNKFSLICKYPPNNKLNIEYHLREILFYQKISNELLNANIPKCFNKKFSKEFLIVLQNLSNITEIKFKTGFKLNQVKLVLKQIAKVHSLFMNIHKKSLEKYFINQDWNLSKLINDNKLLYIKRTKSILKDIDNYKFLKKSTQNCLLKVITSYSNYYDKINNSIKYKSLVHGDLWLSNILFSNNEMYLIDWQFLFYGNSFIDIFFLIYTSISFEMLIKNENYLLNYYYNELISNKNINNEIINYDYKSFLLDLKLSKINSCLYLLSSNRTWLSELILNDKDKFKYIMNENFNFENLKLLNKTSLC